MSAKRGITGFKLGKNKTTRSERAENYKSDGIVAEMKQLVCRYCAVTVPNIKSRIEQHIATAKHKERKDLKTQHQTIFGLKKEDEYAMDLCRVSWAMFLIPTKISADFFFYKIRFILLQAFVGSNIPLYKLRDKEFTDFLAKYTGRRQPSETI